MIVLPAKHIFVLISTEGHMMNILSKRIFFSVTNNSEIFLYIFEHEIA